MKRLRIAFIITLLCFLLSITCFARATPDFTIVYITETGECYHREGCPYLQHSMNSIYIGGAEFNGYRPCSLCDPDMYTVPYGEDSPIVESNSNSSSAYALILVGLGLTAAAGLLAKDS